MYFDAAVVFFTISPLLFRMAMAVLWGVNQKNVKIISIYSVTNGSPDKKKENKDVIGFSRPPQFLRPCNFYCNKTGCFANVNVALTSPCLGYIVV